MDLQKTLERLAKLNAANNKTAGGTNKYFKAKAGRNNLIVLPTPQTNDPFLVWGTHKNLLEVSYKDIACDKHNKGAECLICQVVDDLKKQNWKGNFNIWKPIELKIRYFSPVIDLDDVEAGIQWWGYGKTVLSQFENWLLNLEEDETAFFDIAQPEKVIVSYDPSAAPTEMYKLDKKAAKPFTEEQNTAWADLIKPLTEVFTYEMPQDKIVEHLEEYMDKVKEQLESTNTDDAEEEAPKAAAPKKVSKLDSLKSK